MKRIIAVSLALVGALGLFALGGCSAEPQTVGVVEKGVAPIELTNETGQGLSSIAVKDSSSETYAAALTQEGDVADGGKALVYVPFDEIIAVSADAAAADEEDEAVVVETPEGAVDVKITLASGSSYEIHHIDLKGVTSATLSYDEAANEVYLTFVGSDGSETNTLDTEKAYEDKLAAAQEAAEKKAAEKAAAEKAAQEEADKKAAEEKAAAEKAAQEEAERKAAEERAAAERAAAEQAAAEQAAQESQSYDQSYAGSSDNSGSAGGGEEACVDDLILN